MRPFQSSRSILQFIVAWSFLLTTLPAHAVRGRQITGDSYTQLVAIQNEMQMAASLPVSSMTYAKIRARFDSFEIANKANLSSDSNLLQKYSKLRRIATVQQKFQECLKRFADKNSLGQRVLALTYGLDPASFGCGDSGTPDDAARQIAGVGKAVNNSSIKDLQTQMATQIRVNAATNMADIDYRLEDTNKKSPAQIVTNTVNKICPGSTCSAAEKAKVLSEAQKQIAKLESQGVQPKGIFEAAQAIKAAVSDINDNTDMPFKGANKLQLEQNSQAQYRAYADSYWRASSEGIGILMNTDAVRNKIGEFQNFDGTKKNGSVYNLDIKRLRAEIDPQNLTQAKAEYQKELSDMSSDMAKESKNATDQDTKNSLQRMLKNYPLATAQLLVANPGATQQVCDMINAAEDKQEASSDRKHFRRIASAVAGGVLLGVGVAFTVTGAGAVAGVPMMVAGGTLTTAQVVDSANNYIDAKRQVEEIVKSNFAGSNDQQSLQAQSQARDEASDAAMEVALTLGLSAAAGTTSFLSTTKTVGKAVAGSDLLNRIKAAPELMKTESSLTKGAQVLGEAKGGQMAWQVAMLGKKEQDAALNVLRGLEKNGSKEDYAVFSKTLDDYLKLKKCI